MQYNFEWDPQKAQSNQAKHGVRFEQAATVFRDPRAISTYDEEHSADEIDGSPSESLQPVLYSLSTTRFVREMGKR